MTTPASLRRRGLLVIAALAPSLLLAGCGSGDDQATVSQQVTEAKSAADRAETAQRAAERAAAAAGASQPSAGFVDDEAMDEGMEVGDDGGEVSEGSAGDAPPPPPPPPPVPDAA